MGGYCYEYEYGFHPVGTSHTSATCTQKKADHVKKATWRTQQKHGMANHNKNKEEPAGSCDVQNQVDTYQLTWTGDHR